jgi:hypothetical protein
LLLTEIWILQHIHTKVEKTGHVQCESSESNNI